MSFSDMPLNAAQAGAGFPDLGPPPIIFPTHAGTMNAFPDVSLESPEQQQAYLAAMLADNDLANPAPYTLTPPGGEPLLDASDIVPQPVMDEEYLPPADVEAAAGAELLSVISDPFPPDKPDQVVWYNDEQYYGLGVPPGVGNYGQPVEYAWTQMRGNQGMPGPNPSAEHGWDAWSGRTPIARVARHENNFPGYNASQSRGHMIPVEKFEMPIALQTQQFRDMLLAELKRRGVHTVVVADVPSVPFTQQVAITDPLALAVEAPIGPEGVLP